METRRSFLDPVLRLLDRLIKFLREIIRRKKKIEEKKNREKRVEEKKDKKFKTLQELNVEIKLEDLKLLKERKTFVNKQFRDNPSLDHYS